MTNVIRQKGVFCIEWTFDIPLSPSGKKSEHFKLLNVKCNLKFNPTRAPNRYNNSISANITFESNEELNPAVEVFATFIGNQELHSETHRIKGPNQKIWTWNCDKEPPLIHQLVTFVFTAITNPLREDKSMQTPSYINSSLCLEGISRDFSKLLDEGPNYDVNFLCEDQTIPAHKNVLCCRSSVFTSMLESDMLEGNTGQVKIQDINATIFQQFLRSLYTGILPELTVDTAVQFYKASDKYAIGTIKKQCVEFLVDHLSTENACEILTLADRHVDSNMKKCVIEYISKQKTPLVLENWADFSRQNKDLAMEVFTSFCQHLSLN